MVRDLPRREVNNSVPQLPIVRKSGVPTRQRRTDAARAFPTSSAIRNASGRGLLGHGLAPSGARQPPTARRRCGVRQRAAGAVGTVVPTRRARADPARDAGVARRRGVGPHGAARDRGRGSSRPTWRRGTAWSRNATSRSTTWSSSGGIRSHRRRGLDVGLA